MLITQQRIPVPDSQDRDCVKIAGMALVYAQPVRPAADVPMEREWRTIRPGVPVWRTSTISLFTKSIKNVKQKGVRRHDGKRVCQ